MPLLSRVFVTRRYRADDEMYTLRYSDFSIADVAPRRAAATVVDGLHPLDALARRIDAFLPAPADASQPESSSNSIAFHSSALTERGHRAARVLAGA